MSAWVIDSVQIDFEELHREERRGRETIEWLIAEESDMRQFIHSEKIGHPSRVLVAPKGFGKTMILRYRSHQLRSLAQQSGAVFHPSGESDVEYLQVLFDHREMYNYVVPRVGPQQWARVWECALLVTACQSLDLKSLGSASLDKLFSVDSAVSVSSNLSIILREANNRPSLTGQEIETLRNTFNAAGKDVVAFIDNADEAFAADGIDFTQDHPVIWRDLQIGLLLAIHSVERHSRKLHVYTSLRAEAIVGIKEKTQLQAKSLCVDLRYSKAALRRIFDANIEMFERDKMVSPDALNRIEQWIGYRYVEHPYVTSVSGALQREDIFEFILRHTFMSPRNLMVLGRAMSSAHSDLTGDHGIEALRRCINDLSTSDIFEDWQINAIPRWCSEYDTGLTLINTNVLDAAALDEIDEMVGTGGQSGDGATSPQKFSSYLYQHGLLGFAFRYPGHSYEQRFLEKWRSRFSDEVILRPDADYYFVHPILNQVIRERRGEGAHYEPDKSNIVGFDKPYFNEPPTVVITPSQGALPSVFVLGTQVLDGAKAATNKEVGFMALLYATHRSKNQVLSIGAVKETTDLLVDKFEIRNDWLNMLRTDPGHLNQNLLTVLGTVRHKLPLPEGRVAKNSGEHGEFPASISFSLCDPNEIHIEDSLLLID